MRMRGTRLVIGLSLVGLLAGAQQDCATTTKSSGDQSSKHAKIGDTITLAGSDDKMKMKVKVLRVRSPLTVGDYDEPTKGNRFIGVDIALTNVGKGTYDDAPSNGAKVITSKDEQGDSTIVSQGPCSGGLASDVKIAPGSRRQGCIPFEVPKGKLKTFQLSLDSGFGPESGEWSLR